MNILLSAYACEPGRGSEPGNGWNWALHIAQAGHNVWVLTSPKGAPAIERYLSEHSVAGLHVVYVHTPPLLEPLFRGQAGAFARYFAWQWAAYVEARRLVRRVAFDVVHHVTWASLKGGSWLWRLPVPFVLGPVSGGQVTPPAFKTYFNGTWRYEAARTFLTKRLLPYAPVQRAMLRNTRLVLVANQATQALATQMGAPDARLFLDTGLPDHFFNAAGLRRAASSQGELRILWVGRLFPIKALQLALESVSRLHIPFRLTILGDGVQAARVPGWIEQYGLGGRVDWQGWVPWPDVQKAYRTHDVFLFTSLRDAFGSQLLEAMANGLPIVTLDHHGAHDFVPAEAAIKVPVAHPTDTAFGITNALQTLHTNAKRRAQMSQAGRAYAQTQKWAYRAEKMIEMYENVVN